MDAFVTSFTLIFTSEMGDKSQLISIAFTNLYKIRTVLISVFFAALINNGLAVLFGSLITDHIPLYNIKLLAGILFLYFGISALLKNNNENEKIKNSSLGPIATIVSTYVFSEFGDKTQLAAIALTATYCNPFYILLGTTLGIFSADVIGIIIGNYFNKKLPINIIKYISSFIFILFGISTIYKLLF